MEHRGEKIKIDESPSFKEDGYEVDGRGKMVYKASSRHGRAYSLSAPQAVDDARAQIDRAKGGK